MIRVFVEVSATRVEPLGVIGYLEAYTVSFEQYTSRGSDISAMANAGLEEVVSAGSTGKATTTKVSGSFSSITYDDTSKATKLLVVPKSTWGYFSLERDRKGRTIGQKVTARRFMMLRNNPEVFEPIRDRAAKKSILVRSVDGVSSPWRGSTALFPDTISTPSSSLLVLPPLGRRTGHSAPST